MPTKYAIGISIFRLYNTERITQKKSTVKCDGAIMVAFGTVTVCVRENFSSFFLYTHPHTYLFSLLSILYYIYCCISLEMEKRKINLIYFIIFQTLKGFIFTILLCHPLFYSLSHYHIKKIRSSSDSKYS